MSPINGTCNQDIGKWTYKFSRNTMLKIFVAWHPKSSEENERNYVVHKYPKFGDIRIPQNRKELGRRIVNMRKLGKCSIRRRCRIPLNWSRVEFVSYFE